MGKRIFGSILEVAQQLGQGQTSSRQLVDSALQRIQHPSGEGKRAFTKVYTEAAPAAAEASDRLRQSGVVPSVLAGVPISIKDLFDVAGEPTPAGSLILQEAPPAACDAAAIARLRAAGAVLVGRTNMTEFAYSALGLNAHFGTPSNPYDRQTGRVPGGSSSGAAVSVSDGMAVVGLGTDTGGSLRVPAAFCGLCGFKPTARRIPTQGVLPLSRSLDSVGAICPTVSCSALVDAVLAGEPPQIPAPFPLRGLRLGIPTRHLLDDLEKPVAQAFQRAMSRLSKAGAQVIEVDIPELLEIPAQYDRGGLLGIEAYAWHRRLLERHRDRYDPLVSPRILAASDRSAADYLDLLEARRDLIQRCAKASSPFDALAFPTVPMVAPTFASLQSDQAYFAVNLRALRNTSIGNFLDRCALSIPCHPPGEAPVGLSLMGQHGSDRRLLAIGLSVEEAVREKDSY
ncbi:MAG: amidase [Acidobacteriota bacterium]